MHTKEMIMEALGALHKEFPETDSYGFSTYVVAKKIGRTDQTTSKWCHVLVREGKIIRTWHKYMSRHFGVRLMEVN